MADKTPKFEGLVDPRTPDNLTVVIDEQVYER